MSRRLAQSLAVLLPLIAAGCETAPPVQTTFPALHYDYLTPLHLNVASIDIEDRFVPAPGGPAALAPVPPIDALRQMAQDRLMATGSSGRAVFVIEDASIVPVAGDGLSGTLAVRLDVMTGDGTRAGFAEARVSRVVTGIGGDERAAVYDLVRRMMVDMNVEFEFQVKRSLRDWLQVTTTAPAPAAVEQQDLGPPSTTPVP